jgi:cyclopropane fatty-acyl-phospholipid synthase-like methyltransferase
VTHPLPYSEACERNRHSILGVLRTAFADRHRVLEIGAGTGQHAVHFARHLPWLAWLPTDRREYLVGLAARVASEGPPNLAPAVELDVLAAPWPRFESDAAFSANTLHIMSWRAVESLFAGVGSMLPAGGVLAVYGPFHYGGRATSDSNAAFDAMLRERDPGSGVREFEAVDALAQAAGLALQADHAMPANNRLLVWRRA